MHDALGHAPAIHAGSWRSLCAAAVTLGRDIKLSHSVFALPFALLATFLAAASRVDHPGLPGVVTLGLIVLCMVLARTMAMAVNRLADARLDAANPRTVGRAIPSGRLSPRFVAASAALCAAGFVLASAGFWWHAGNPWPLLLSPVAMIWLAAYSFAKRFTAMCHLWLGSSLALSPIAAVVAVEPGFLCHSEPYLLAGMVLCWVAGFDVIYALQDVEVDRRQGLHSLPAKLGVSPALWISRGLHALALAVVAALGWVSAPLGTGFSVGVAATAILLMVEHALVCGSRTHRIPLAFLTVNGIISLLLGGLGIADVVRWL